MCTYVLTYSNPWFSIFLIRHLSNGAYNPLSMNWLVRHDVLNSIDFGQKNLQHGSTLGYKLMSWGKLIEKSRKFHFSFKFSVLLSPPCQVSARGGNWRVHTGDAVMWFQCLGPCSFLPSGGKPLRLSWHITTPIINSRSALSFLLHLSSFRLTATSICFACALISAPGPFTLNTFLLIFCLWTIIPFFPHSQLHHTALNGWHSYQASTSFTRRRQNLARKRFSKWKHIGLWTWSDWRGSDDSTDLSQTITKRLQSTRELYSTFALGVSHQKTRRIDFLLPTFTSQGSPSSIPLLFID